MTVVAAQGVSESQVRGLGAALERGSEHPLAATIIAKALERKIELPSSTSFSSVTGQGVKGSVAGHAIALGNRALLESMDIQLGDLASRAEELRSDGQTVMFVAIDGRAAGILAVADPMKISTPEAIAQLHQEGVRIVMLTGDSKTTAEAVARKLGIDDVVAGVRPDQKAEKVRELQALGRVVAMAGDGINDAPALAQAAVGPGLTGADRRQKVVTKSPERTWAVLGVATSA